LRAGKNLGGHAKFGGPRSVVADSGRDETRPSNMIWTPGATCLRATHRQAERVLQMN
jgi:hypothetical protein